jgi:hypothetical protein
MLELFILIQGPEVIINHKFFLSREVSGMWSFLSCCPTNLYTKWSSWHSQLYERERSPEYHLGDFNFLVPLRHNERIKKLKG